MERQLNSEIEAVTVYSSGAAVTRIARLQPAGGVWPAEVRLAGLPLALDDASVRVRVEAAAGAPTATGFRVALEAPGGAENEPPDKEALRAARKQVRFLEGRLQDLDRLIGRIAAMSLPARPAPRKGEPPPPSPHKGRAALLEFRQQKLKELTPAAEELREKLRAAREALADAEDRWRIAGAAREPRPDELRKTVVIALSAPRPDATGTAKLLLEYHVPGARWAPAYSFHFEKDFSRATVSARAVVGQRTGEDWNNVRLTLSTARIEAWTELPELAALRLGRWQSPPSSGWRPLPAGAEELYADYDRDSAGLRKELAPALEQKPSDTGEFAIAAAAPESALAADLIQDLAEAPARGAPVGAGRTLFARIRLESAGPPPAPVPPPLAAPLPPAAEPTVLFAGPAPPRPEPPARPAPALFDYSALRMPGPAEAARGRLARLEAAARLEISAAVRMEVEVDAAGVVQAAQSEAARLGDLPPAHAFASSVEGFDYAYLADLPVNILSDGRFHSIPLLTREAGVRPYYVTVPREAPDVFRFAEIDNPLDAPLLPGPADIYVENEFLMTGPLRLTPATGMIELGIGVEQLIKVARNTGFAEEPGGLMGGTLNLKHEIDIELRNLLQVPAQVEVRERVPVTRDGEEHLKVTATARPPWEPYEPARQSLRGGYAWKVCLQPSEVTRLHAAYTIGMPAKMEIATGNRRER